MISQKVWKNIISAIAVAMSLVQLYGTTTGKIPLDKWKGIYLGFTVLLVFLIYPSSSRGKKENPKALDLLFAALGVYAAGYLVYHFDTIARRGLFLNTYDIVTGGICVVVVLEAARRQLGPQLPILALLFLAYACLGPYLPGLLSHSGYSTRRIVEHMYMSAEGIFGIPIATSTSIIFMFVLFGSFLSKGGMTSFFIDFAKAIAGGSRGGPAKIATIASGLLGMISGSAAANVVTTGTFTIPMMKNVGFRPAFAGAVEAVASTGGQIMPPIMGAAAFVMAEMLGVPYRQIMIAAIIPAVLYFVACWFCIDLQAAKRGLRGLPRQDLPRLVDVIKQRGYLIVPVVLLVYLILEDYTPSYAAVWSLVCLLAITSFRRDDRFNIKKLWRALEDGARASLVVGNACAVVGIVVGIVSLTGVGLRLANLIVLLSAGRIYLGLILTMVACIVLGMGLPTTPCYIVASMVAAPALLKLGIEGLPAHMFIFYFACLAAITPPVAIAAYAAAGLSGGNPTETGWLAFGLGLAGFIVPFAFVTSPQLLLLDVRWGSLIYCVVTAVLGCYALSMAVIGYVQRPLPLYLRALSFVSAAALILPAFVISLVGAALLGIVLLLQRVHKPILERATSGLQDSGDS